MLASYKRIRSQARVSTVSLTGCNSHENGISGISARRPNDEIPIYPLRQMEDKGRNLVGSSAGRRSPFT